MKNLTKLFLPTTLTIEMDSFKKNQDFRLTIVGDYNPHQTPELSTYMKVEKAEIENKGNDNVILKEEKEEVAYVFGLNIHIQGDFVLIDYKPMHAPNEYLLSELLGFEHGYLAKGNLSKESFRTIQLRLQGVLSLYANDYVRMAA